MEIILVLVVVMISSMAAIAKVMLVVVHLSHASWGMLYYRYLVTAAKNLLICQSTKIYSYEEVSSGSIPLT
jgi:hypothetical protein